MNKKNIITAFPSIARLPVAFLLALVAMTVLGQTSFDAKEGCLNVVDFSFSQSIGEYGDRCLSAYYTHERFINEQFSIGGGIGYSHHKDYNFSAIPVFLSSHYFFLDNRFSPYANLRVGGFALFNAKSIGTNEKYSLSRDKQGFSLFISPNIGLNAYYTEYWSVGFCE